VAYKKAENKPHFAIELVLLGGRDGCPDTPLGSSAARPCAPRWCRVAAQLAELAGRAGVRAAAGAAGVDHLVAAACLRAGRSSAPWRAAAAAGAARTAGAARHDAASESLAPAGGRRWRNARRRKDQA